MKILLTLIISLLTLNCFSQAFIEQPDVNIVKPDYKYILVWRNWEGHMVQNGDMMSVINSWKINFEGFNTIKEIMNWINTSSVDFLGREHHDIYTRINKDQFIAIYDLLNSKKIHIKFKTEQKSLPKRVEIEAEKWTETKAEIIN